MNGDFTPSRLRHEFRRASVARRKLTYPIGPIVAVWTPEVTTIFVSWAANSSRAMASIRLDRNSYSAPSPWNTASRRGFCRVQLLSSPSPRPRCVSNITSSISDHHTSKVHIMPELLHRFVISSFKSRLGVALLSSGAIGAIATIVVTPVPIAPPALVLNEVMFDPTGVDAQAVFGSEWVELYTFAKITLSDYRLRTNTGAQLGNLPNVVVPSGTHVVIALGGDPGADTIDGNAADGNMKFLLGIAPGDYLGNNDGGVTLENIATGQRVDSVFWGNGSPPPGSGGSYLDISFNGSPLDEGQSIGRSSLPGTTYTGTMSDWATWGGKNAAGPTPGLANELGRPGTMDMLKWTQAGVNDFVTSYGMAEQVHWFQFLNSTFAKVITVATADGVEISARHSFDTLVNGQAMTLSGDLKSTFASQPTSTVGYRYSANGTLAFDNGDSFLIDYSLVVSGFRSPNKTLTSQTTMACTYTTQGVAYPFSTVTNKSIARTGSASWSISDQRTAVDYGGGNAKHSSGTTSVTRLGDSCYATSLALSRDWPIMPPLPGHTNPTLSTESFQVAGQCTILNDLGEFSNSVSVLNMSRNGVLRLALASGSTGTTSMSVDRTSTVSPLAGRATGAMHFPLVLNGAPWTFDAALSATLSANPSAFGIATTGTYAINGVTRDTLSTYVDPPLQGTGGAAGHSAPESFTDAVANCCFKGWAVGAGAGTAVGGVAGAIGGEVVGGAVGVFGGPATVVAAAQGGGWAGAGAGSLVGAGAGGVIGSGVGSLSCALGWLTGWW